MTFECVSGEQEQATDPLGSLGHCICSGCGCWLAWPHGSAEGLAFAAGDGRCLSHCCDLAPSRCQGLLVRCV